MAKLESRMVDNAKSNDEGESRWKLYRAGLLIMAVIALATVVAIWGQKFPDWLKACTPVCFTILAWLVLRWGYQWLRAGSYRRRNNRWKNDPAERVQKPDGVRKPDEFPGVEASHSAQWNYLPKAPDAQGEYFADGILIAALSPMALLLLSLQVLVWPEGGWWAFGLILSEMLCMLFLVFLAMTKRDPTAEWIENRVRSELFRREQYLALGGVGPYLGMDARDTSSKVLERCGQIESARAQDLVRLIRMQGDSGMNWMESLHHKGASALAGRSDCIERMESYLYHRIGKQIQWFANSGRDCEENDRNWSGSLYLTLFAAIAVGIVDTVRFFLESLQGAKPAQNQNLWILSVGMLGIVLPPLSAAFLSIQNMYNFRGRSRIYAHEKALLQEKRGELGSLLERAKNSSETSPPDHTMRDIDFKFRAIVLRTEHSLSIEMEQWMLLMEKKQIDASS